MSMLLLLEIMRSRVLKQSPVYGPGTHSVTIGPTVTVLETLTGRGGVGQPGSPGSQSYSYEQTIVYDRRDGGQDFNSQNGNGSGPIPGPGGCTYTSTPGSTIYTGYTQCVYYTDTSSGGSSPTTGPSTTAFGRTFPGGTGGAASSRTDLKVPVTPGNYTIFVAAGGTLSYTYLE